MDGETENSGFKFEYTFEHDSQEYQFCDDDADGTLRNLLAQGLHQRYQYEILRRVTRLLDFEPTRPRDDEEASAYLDDLIGKTIPFGEGEAKFEGTVFEVDSGNSSLKVRVQVGSVRKIITVQLDIPTVPLLPM